MQALTPRQREVVNAYIAHPNAQRTAIAELLCISDKTLRTHVWQILNRLDAPSMRAVVQMEIERRHDDESLCRLLLVDGSVTTSTITIGDILRIMQGQQAVIATQSAVLNIMGDATK